MAQTPLDGSADSAHTAHNERRRVKVYELKNNDWYDRGTGSCIGEVVSAQNAPLENLDARIIVVSEEDSSRVLLETRITKDDGYQKQQDTLIVWTEANGVDMALSFQEAEGCASIWHFVSDVQTRLGALAQDDALSDELLDSVHAIVLPEPAIGRLDEIEAMIRAAAMSPPGRDALTKFIMHPEQMYISKLTPLVAMAEDLESLSDLHRLCTIMKHLILLNDTSIIEFVVTDQAIMGVVGALEYDPDFPSHRANHRQYLSDASKFKEVVPIQDPEILHKIHWTYRLLYLKDVVLARILDDPTFSVLNSLIFFHQVDIVNHLQSNLDFLQQLFAIFGSEEHDASRKKEAVLFIQNCCVVSKNIQAPSRAQLYQNFIHHGLFTVVTFALRHRDAAVRVAGTDILVALIDHDPHMVRTHIFAAIRDKQTPLTDTLIELLLVEVDLGVKSQMADAIKILLDPVSTAAGFDMVNRANNPELLAKQRGAGGQNMALSQQHSPQTLHFIESFYDGGAKRLFAPLKALEGRPTMSGLGVHETNLFTHLVDILCFFVRQHHHRSKGFILGEHLHSRIAQLLSCPQKYMKLTAIKWFRTCVGLQDEFHNRQIVQEGLFEPILRIVEETMPRDNLLNSACLELFEWIRKDGNGQLLTHLVENYRERLMAITYVNIFQALVIRYDTKPVKEGKEGDDSFSTQEGTPRRLVNGRQAFAGLKEMDHDEQAYFEGDDDIDDDDDDDESLPTSAKQAMINGTGPVRPLVNYPDDEDDPMDLLASSPDPHKDSKKSSSSTSSGSRRPLAASSAAAVTADAMDDDIASSPAAAAERGRNRTPVPLDGSPGHAQHSPPEPLAAKRRRADFDDEDDDELGKMMGGAAKRRNSDIGAGSNRGKSGTSSLDGAGADDHGASTPQEEQQQQQQADGAAAAVPTLRRKGSLKTRNESAASSAGKFVVKPLSLAAKGRSAAQAAKKEKKAAEATSTAASDSAAVGDGEGGGGRSAGDDGAEG